MSRAGLTIYVVFVGCILAMMHIGIVMALILSIGGIALGLTDGLSPTMLEEQLAAAFPTPDPNSASSRSSLGEGDSEADHGGNVDSEQEPNVWFSSEEGYAESEVTLSRKQHTPQIYSTPTALVIFGVAGFVAIVAATVIGCFIVWRGSLKQKSLTKSRSA